VSVERRKDREGETREEPKRSEEGKKKEKPWVKTEGGCTSFYRSLNG
jgi:hypothetical protein